MAMYPDFREELTEFPLEQLTQWFGYRFRGYPAQDRPDIIQDCLTEAWGRWYDAGQRTWSELSWNVSRTVYRRISKQWQAIQWDKNHEPLWTRIQYSPFEMKEVFKYLPSRQILIVNLLLQGLCTAQIARRCRVSERQIQRDMQQIEQVIQSSRG